MSGPPPAPFASAGSPGGDYEGTEGAPPPMPMFTPLPGYDPARMGALLPPPPVNIQLETPHFEMPKLALGPTEDRVRAALLKEVGAHCCWGDKAAKEAKITKIMPSSAFNYDLQSWTEGRQTDWTFEPFRGQMIDGPEHGPAPGPWDISVIPPPPHTNAVKKSEVPHSATVQGCHHCNAKGKIRCSQCMGHERIACTSCHGNGRVTRTRFVQKEDGTQHSEQYEETCHLCAGSGRISCPRCSGTGKVKCPTCDGMCRLKHFLQLTVTWTNHVDNYVLERSDLPDHLITGAQGDTVFEYAALRVPPINFFHENDINTASARLVQSHSVNWPMERTLGQVHHVRQVPVAECHYQWKDQVLRYWVYGKEDAVHAPDYPMQCCGNCVML